MRTSAGHPPGSQDTPLFELVFQRISESQAGAVPFSHWMELALYDPEHGYYCRRASGPGYRQLGRKGDFYTSVSVGEMFGLLLAHGVHREWETRFSRCLPFVIVEQGAHDGQLARDLIAGLREMGSPLLEGLEYRIVEPRAALRGQLAERLAAEPSGPLRVVDGLESARAPQGLFLCNELLDAFPVDRLVFEEGTWRERWVAWDSEGRHPTWTSRELRPEWRDFVELLGGDYPEGYETELCLGVDAWMEEAAPLFDEGLWWIIDYGYERSDYYDPRRSRGTLRCYRDHQAGEDPFAFPGEQDLSAHVDFTRVELAAQRCGLKTLRFTDQHHFLIEAARPWLLSQEGRSPDAATMKRLRQFQTLTHPGMMGQQFKVMELAKRRDGGR